MDLNEPEAWRWIWLAAALGFGLGEMVTPGAFFFLPFAGAAAVAAVLGFMGVPVTVEWIVFVVLAVASFAALWPIGRRLERSGPQHAVGATRWVGKEGLVVDDIPGGPSGTGTIRLERERWRAESLTGVPIVAGSTVLVRRVEGTRLVVVPTSDYTLPEGDS